MRFIGERLYDYLEKEFYKNNVPKYHKYFRQWVDNLTETQIHTYETIWLK